MRSTVALCLALFAPPLAAQLHARHLLSHSASHDTLVTKDGKHVYARVMSVDGNDVRLEEFVGGGSAVVTRKLADFDAESQFMIRAAVTPDQSSAYLTLAHAAVAAGQIPAAVSALAKARSLAGDPKVGADVTAEIHKWRSGYFEKQFARNISEGDVEGARQTLGNLKYRYGDVVSKDKLEAMQSQIASVISTRQAAYVKERDTEEAKQAAQRRQGLVHPLQRLVDDAERRHSAAMKAPPASSEAGEDFEAAIHESERARQMAAAMTKQHANDQQLLAMITPLGQRATKVYTSAMMDSASRLIMQGQLNKAMGYANRILAMNPNDQAAQSMRARIELAANSSGW